jgi:hypothetical protein
MEEKEQAKNFIIIFLEIVAIILYQRIILQAQWALIYY